MDIASIIARMRANPSYSDATSKAIDLLVTHHNLDKAAWLVTVNPVLNGIGYAKLIEDMLNDKLPKLTEESSSIATIDE